MTLFLSRPFEELSLKDRSRTFHTIIVGSGYGAAMAALGLAMRPNKDYRNEQILVIERGREFVPGDFPKTISDLPEQVSVQGNAADRKGYGDALLDVRIGTGVNIVVGSGLGGTSLINAGVAVDPDASLLQHFPPSAAHPAWEQRLRPSLQFIRELLAVQQHPAGQSLPKVNALQKLAASLGTDASHCLADIAVNFADGPNRVGVQQQACTNCGNCFTGCNTNAKGTLAVNAWPLARRLGVDIVTGGTVIRLRRIDADAQTPWRVWAHQTTDATGSFGTDPASTLELKARRIILAAGTLGSTEILQRSSTPGAAPDTLRVSSKLGSRFTLNGDGIAFGFGQRAAVEGVAQVPSTFSVTPALDQRPGPTIVSMIRLRAQGRHGLIQDATIPQSLVRPLGELLSTQALMRCYGPGGRAAWHQDHPGTDPLTVSDELLKHQQALLLMGADDHGRSTLSFDTQYNHIHIEWPQSARPPAPDPTMSGWFDRHLQRAASGDGFDGGLYLPSPLWRPLPANFESVFEGADALGGTQLCNHPLGGCPMGDSAASGVVNPMGQVFKSDTGLEVYADLYVLDGSIVPAALGVNPFMTIAAFAHQLALDMDGPVYPGAYTLPPAEAVTLPVKQGHPISWPVPALPFSFSERLFGPTDAAECRALYQTLGVSFDASKPPTNAIALDVEIQIPDLYRWLSDPSQLLQACFTLYQNQCWDKTIDTVADDWLTVLGRGTGSVQLFAPAGGASCWRAFLAIWRFFSLRGDELWDLGRTSANSSLLDRVSGFLRVAFQHGHWRVMNYRTQMPANGRTLQISGTKRLAYDGSRDRSVRDEANLWTTLCNIQLTFRHTNTGEQASAWFHVDLLRMSRGLAALQVHQSVDTPPVVSAAASLGGLALRVLLQTHLWSFGAPSYERFPTLEQLSQAGLYTAPERVQFKDAGRIDYFPVEVCTPAAPHTRLLRVHHPDRESELPPVLLIHGIAHSSRVFYTPTIDKNLAGYLVAAGYDVYLIDHGLSIGLRPEPTYRPIIENIATQLRATIRQIYDTDARPRGKRVLVFSHCIGSAALSMSILGDDGALQDQGMPIIQALVMHAVPPWIHASEANLVRAYVGVFFRRFFPASLTPIPDVGQSVWTRPAAFDNVLDRIGSSIPWTAAEYASHNHTDSYGKLCRTVCNRMTLLYGYDWSHANLNEATHDALHLMMGPVNSDIYRELYFLVNRQRITTKEGANTFLQEDNVMKQWTFPTLFLHGEQNQTFNDESSVLSAKQLQSINAWRAKYYHGPSVSVQLKLVPGYGHLDAIIGQDAQAAVFAHARDFFLNGSGSFNKPEPKSSTQAFEYPVTGPIISFPRVVNGKRFIRLWLETNEWQTSSTSAVNFVPVDPREGASKPVWIRAAPALPAPDHRQAPQPDQRSEANPNALKNSMFWIADLPCDDLRSPIAPRLTTRDGHWLDYHTQVPLFPQANSQPPVWKSLDASTASNDSPGPTDSDTSTDVVMDWTALAWFQRFMNPTDSSRLSLILGSCWYPGSWFDELSADRIFGLIREHVVAESGVDLMLLVGDQIYADASYAIFDIAENRERYQESYRHAFRSEHARWVLRHLPTFFAIDDHEFRDNYPSAQYGDTPRKMRALATAARMEAWNFQMSHGRPPQLDNIYDNQLWYPFQSCDFDFFVFDTRSERDISQSGLRRILSEAQELGFRSWVASLTKSNKPVFVVTGSPLAPAPLDEIRHPAATTSSDGLRGFPQFVGFLVETLSGAIPDRPLVLLSGDPHFSSMCRIRLRDSGRQINGAAIISSGVNVPLPFANDRPDSVPWGPDPVSLTFPDCTTQVDIVDPRLLSTARAHVLRLDMQSTERGAWDLTVTVLEADARTPPTSVRLTL